MLHSAQQIVFAALAQVAAWVRIVSAMGWTPRTPGEPRWIKNYIKGILHQQSQATYKLREASRAVFRASYRFLVAPTYPLAFHVWVAILQWQQSWEDLDWQHRRLDELRTGMCKDRHLTAHEKRKVALCLQWDVSQAVGDDPVEVHAHEVISLFKACGMWYEPGMWCEDQGWNHLWDAPTTSTQLHLPPPLPPPGLHQPSQSLQ